MPGTPSTQRFMPPQRAIMVVDDDPLMCLLLREALTMQGFGVTTCSNGDEALAVLRGKAFDLLITDYEMPMRTGVDLLRCLRADGILLPAILMSSYPFDVIGSLTAGLARQWFLQKPFRMQELHIAIRRAFMSLS